MKKSYVNSAALVLAALVAVSATSVSAQTAGDLLVNLSYNQEAAWTNLSAGNTSWVTVSATEKSVAASTGTGTLTVNSPGYPASIGLYSWQGDFSVKVEATPSYAGSFTNVNSVVLQLGSSQVVGVVDDEVFYTTVEEHLTFQGGPLLVYALADGITFGVKQATQYGTLNDFEIEDGVFHGIPLVYYSFTWVWDLTGIGSPENPVVSVTIYAPLVNHFSTVGAQLSLHGTYDSNFFTTFGGDRVGP